MSPATMPRGYTRWLQSSTDGKAPPGISYHNSEKKKNKKRHEGDLLAAADRPSKQHKGSKPTPDHFKKMLKEPCPNHGYPAKHLYKDCNLMKHYLKGNLKVSTKGKLPSAADINTGTRMPSPSPRTAS